MLKNKIAEEQNGKDSNGFFASSNLKEVNLVQIYNEPWAFASRNIFGGAKQTKLTKKAKLEKEKPKILMRFGNVKEP